MATKSTKTVEIKEKTKAKRNLKIGIKNSTGKTTTPKKETNIKETKAKTTTNKNSKKATTDVIASKRCAIRPDSVIIKQNTGKRTLCLNLGKEKQEIPNKDLEILEIPVTQKIVTNKISTNIIDKKELNIANTPNDTVIDTISEVAETQEVAKNDATSDFDVNITTDATVEEVANDVVADETASVIEDVTNDIVTDKTASVIENVTNDIVTDETASVIENVTNDVVADETASVIEDVTNDVVTDETASVIEDVTNDVVADETASVVEDVTNDVVADETASVVEDVTNDVVADETASVVEDVTNDVVADETVSVVEDVTNDVVADETASVVEDVTNDVVADETASVIEDVNDDVVADETASVIEDVNDDVVTDETASVIEDVNDDVVTDETASVIEEVTNDVVTDETASVVEEVNDDTVVNENTSGVEEENKNIIVLATPAIPTPTSKKDTSINQNASFFYEPSIFQKFDITVTDTDNLENDINENVSNKEITNSSTYNKNINNSDINSIQSKPIFDEIINDIQGKANSLIKDITGFNEKSYKFIEDIYGVSEEPINNISGITENIEKIINENLIDESSSIFDDSVIDTIDENINNLEKINEDNSFANTINEFAKLGNQETIVDEVPVVAESNDEMSSTPIVEENILNNFPTSNSEVIDNIDENINNLEKEISEDNSFVDTINEFVELGSHETVVGEVPAVTENNEEVITENTINEISSTPIVEENILNDFPTSNSEVINNIDENIINLEKEINKDNSFADALNEFVELGNQETVVGEVPVVAESNKEIITENTVIEDSNDKVQETENQVEINKFDNEITDTADNTEVDSDEVNDVIKEANKIIENSTNTSNIFTLISNDNSTDTTIENSNKVNYEPETLKESASNINSHIIGINDTKITPSNGNNTSVGKFFENSIPITTPDTNRFSKERKAILSDISAVFKKFSFDDAHLITPQENIQLNSISLQNETNTMSDINQALGNLETNSDIITKFETVADPVATLTTPVIETNTVISPTSNLSSNINNVSEETTYYTIETPETNSNYNLEENSNEDILGDIVSEESVVEENSNEDILGDIVSEESVVEQNSNEDILGDIVSEEPVVEENSNEDILEDIISEEPVIEQNSNEDILGDIVSEEPVVEQNSNEDILEDIISEEPVVEQNSNEDILEDIISEEPVVEQNSNEDILGDIISEESVVEENSNEDILNDIISEESIIEEFSSEQFYDDIQEEPIIEGISTESEELVIENVITDKVQEPAVEDVIANEVQDLVEYINKLDTSIPSFEDNSDELSNIENILVDKFSSKNYIIDDKMKEELLTEVLTVENSTPEDLYNEEIDNSQNYSYEFEEYVNDNNNLELEESQDIIEKESIFDTLLEDNNNDDEDIIDDPTADLFKMMDSLSDIISDLENDIENENSNVKEQDLVNNYQEELNEEDNSIFENRTLLISEETQKVYLPYSLGEILEILNTSTQYKSIEEVIENEYILPLSTFKNPVISRFKEAYSLMRVKENSSVYAAIDLSLELMFNSSLNPAIIRACSNLDELNSYLDCLYNNQPENFNAFKVVYKLLPKQ